MTFRIKHHPKEALVPEFFLVQTRHLFFFWLTVCDERGDAYIFHSKADAEEWIEEWRMTA